MQVYRFPTYHEVLYLLDTSVGATDQALKTSAGVLVGFDASNTHATEWAYLKFYDAASVTVTTAVPTWSVALPPASAVRVEYDRAVKFDTAIHYACTQERGAGATAPTTPPTVHFRYR